MSRPRRLTTFGWPASALVIGALLLPAGAAAQERTVETATSGAVTAELSYIKRVGVGESSASRSSGTSASASCAAGRCSTTGRSASPARSSAPRGVSAHRRARRAARPERRRRAGGDRGPVHRRHELLRAGVRLRVRRRREQLPPGAARHRRRIRGARPRPRRRDRTRRRRLPLPRPVHLRRLRRPPDPHLAVRAHALRGRHARVSVEDPRARAADEAPLRARAPQEGRARVREGGAHAVYGGPLPARPLRHRLPAGAPCPSARRARPCARPSTSRRSARPT